MKNNQLIIFDQTFSDQRLAWHSKVSVAIAHYLAHLDPQDPQLWMKRDSCHTVLSLIDWLDRVLDQGSASDITYRQVTLTLSVLLQELEIPRLCQTSNQTTMIPTIDS